MGLETFKLPFGHHGANHPVRDLQTGRVEITSQNHGFAALGPGGARTIDSDARARARQPVEDGSWTWVVSGAPNWARAGIVPSAATAKANERPASLRREGEWRLRKRCISN